MREEQMIIPAIIPTSSEMLRAELAEFGWVHEVHVDVVDGQFVPPVSWPYNPSGHPMDVADICTEYCVEVDLMCADPLAVAGDWVAAGAEMLVWHAETVSVQSFVEFGETHLGVSMGVSALNDTPWEVLEPFLVVADYVQLMGIAQIGAQGAGFDQRVFEQIARVRSVNPSLPICVDGSVNETTIEQLVEAGADRLIVGSALLQAEDRTAQYDYLDGLARPH